MYNEDNDPSWTTYGYDQVLVEAWVRKTFGDKIMDSALERGLRVLEEAIELYQVQARAGNPDKTRAIAHALVDAVFDKPPGVLAQEVGGLGVTLLALCAHHDMRLDSATRAEIDRIQSADRDKIRSKQKLKAASGLGLSPE